MAATVRSVQAFPEIDRVAWCDPSEARRLIKPAQIPLLDRLEEALAGEPSVAQHPDGAAP